MEAPLGGSEGVPAEAEVPLARHVSSVAESLERVRQESPVEGKSSGLERLERQVRDWYRENQKTGLS